MSEELKECEHANQGFCNSHDCEVFDECPAAEDKGEKEQSWYAWEERLRDMSRDELQMECIRQEAGIRITKTQKENEITSLQAKIINREINHQTLLKSLKEKDNQIEEHGNEMRKANVHSDRLSKRIEELEKPCGNCGYDDSQGIVVCEACTLADRLKTTKVVVDAARMVEVSHCSKMKLGESFTDRKFSEHERINELIIAIRAHDDATLSALDKALCSGQGGK